MSGLLAAIGVLICLAIPPAPAAAATSGTNLAFLKGGPVKRFFGVTETEFNVSGFSSPAQMVNLATPLGVNSIRTGIHWSQAEPVPPVAGVHSYQFDQFDQLYNAQLARGIRPLIMIFDSPPWTWANPSDPWQVRPPSSDHMGDWRSFCSAVAKRYPLAAGIEVWNEPNWPSNWGGSPSATGYAQLLQNCYSAIKAARPTMTVVGGALAVTSPDYNSWPAFFASDVIKALGSSKGMDAISVHLYPSVPHPTTDPSLFTGALDQVKWALSNTGTQLPIWVTEAGASTGAASWDPNPFSLTDQGTALVRLEDYLARDPAVAAFYIHALVVPRQFDEWERGFALADPNGVGGVGGFTTKPAYQAVASLNRR